MMNSNQRETLHYLLSAHRRASEKRKEVLLKKKYDDIGYESIKRNLVRAEHAIYRFCDDLASGKND